MGKKEGYKCSVLETTGRIFGEICILHQEYLINDASKSTKPYKQTFKDAIAIWLAMFYKK